MKSTFTLLAVFCSSILLLAQTPSGELKRWHKVTLSFTGPNTSETANPNPFSNYRLDVTFTNGSSSYTVPGYYAGCENPEESSCDSGAIWKVHFSPGKTGAWNWTASFKSGDDIAIKNGGSSAGFMDGDSGTFNIEESDKTGRDHRAKEKGMLQYVGEHYLRYSGTDPENPNGDWFVKGGADSPENALAYEDFDNTPNRGNRRKSWSPHQRDYVASDAASYTWKNGKGSELLGAVNYLSNKGLNAFSFLTLSLHGDDENVFPHLLKVGVGTYNGYNDGQQWNRGVHKDRFDVSKLAQWEKIFEYGDKKGMFMHFKTMETENDNIMDNNSNGRERKLYYRELIARFGHHLALNWNITEESTIPDNVVKSIASYIKRVDPYDHHIVLHTYPNERSQRYTPLLGSNSELTGPSIQTNNFNIHGPVKEWIDKSRNAGKKWVVACDEPGNARIGIDSDPKDNNKVREEVLWPTFMAGGMGVEYYYGYETGETDLSAEDHRSRDTKYNHVVHALTFLNNNLQKHLPNMVSSDRVTADNNDHVFADAGKIYVVYRPNGGTTAISLPSGKWQVQWFNPRSGGALSSPKDITNSLVAPNNSDWVALIKGETDGGSDCDQLIGNSVEDAYLQGSTRFNTNEIRVEQGNRVAYLRFTIPSTEEEVKSIKLKLTVNDDPGEGTIDIFKGGAGNWTEENLSDANKPSEGNKIGTVSGSFNEGQSYEWLLSGVTQGETISLIVKHAGSNDVSFHSKEGAVAPQVIVEAECDTTGEDTCVPTEQNGVVAVEAEKFVNQSKDSNRRWYVLDGSTSGPTPDPDPSHHNGASGGSYLEILPDTRVTHDDPLNRGISFSNTPGETTIVDYKVKFSSPGKYYVWVRAYSTGTEDNGVHVGINGTWPESGARLQWCQGKNQWTWESKQRTDAEHCGVARQIYLDVPTAGIHTISFSLREDGFEMDKFVLSKSYTKPSGNGPDVMFTDCSLSVGGVDTPDNLFITPNPANEMIFLKGLTNDAKVTIYNMLGKKVISEVPMSASDDKLVNIQSLSEGMYFMVIQSDNRTQSLKFLKKS